MRAPGWPIDQQNHWRSGTCAAAGASLRPVRRNGPSARALPRVRAGSRGGCRTGDRCRRSPGAPSWRHRYGRLPVVLPEQESGGVRGCRYVCHAGRGAGPQDTDHACAWRQPKYFHALIGGNFRIDEIQAAVLGIKLKYLDDWTAGRQRNADYYAAAFKRAGLTSQLVLPTVTPGARHIWNQYVIRANRRDQLKSFLGQRGVGTEIYYPVPLHLQKCFA